ncbi:inward rectifier potassium channel [Oxalobacteraceae bacterium GrIS 2.11]
MSKRTAHKSSQNFVFEGRQFIAHGVNSQFWHDIYHYAMTSTWPVFFAVFASTFLSLNFVFATLYSIGDNAVANLYPSGFWGAFFFSVETLATVGYGDMHPQSVYGHIVATAEIFIGMVGIAMMTGVMFARFSRPKAKILFTKHPITSHHNGEYVLSIRIANTRLNVIAEASAKLRLLRLETTDEGVRFMKIIDLPLKRDQHPMFAMGWNLFHTIDEDSPFHHKNARDFEACNARLILSIEGVDETTSQTIRARHNYPWDTFRFNHRYVDISSFDSNSISHYDYSMFDEIEVEALAHDTP